MSQNDEFDVFDFDPSEYKRKRYSSRYLWVSMIGILIGLGGSSIFFGNRFAQIIDQSPPTRTPIPSPQTSEPLPAITPLQPISSYIIYDFEQYTGGQLLAGQDNWIAIEPCNIEIIKGKENSYARAGSCEHLQSTRRYFRSSRLDRAPASFYFRGRITAGTEAAGSALLALSTHLDQKIIFGIDQSPDDKSDYQVYLETMSPHSYWGASLKPGRWYEFRLDIDWDHTSPEGYGLGTLYYQPWGRDRWTTNPSMKNVDLGIRDPIELIYLELHMTGLNEQRGEIDDIGVTITP